MTIQPLISIITPVCNNEETVARTIRSVQNQSYENWELIIVNDCSSDNSLKIIQSFLKYDRRILLINNKANFGPAISRNKAIEKATGRFIAFLDSDDEWLPNKLKAQSKFMLDNNFALSCTEYTRVSSSGKKLSTVSPPEVLRYQDLLKRNWIGCLTAMYDSHQLGKVYMPPIKKRQDLALWLTIIKRTKTAHCLKKDLAKYTVGSANSVSKNKLLAAKYQWELYYYIEKLPLHSCLWSFFCYALAGCYSRLAERYTYPSRHSF